MEFCSFFQSESGATESGSITSCENDSDIELEMKKDPQAITVPITVCVAIMIGYVTTIRRRHCWWCWNCCIVMSKLIAFTTHILTIFSQHRYIFLGAVLFKAWEGWDYLDGSYFCFISLSSIGFGDLVPGAAVS